MPRHPTIEADGWTLVSAEERHRANPDTFHIPPLDRRSSLSPGDGVKLLFDIEIREGGESGRVIDRGVHRMWVIVKAAVGDGYVGILDSDPGEEGAPLGPGDEIHFGPEHVCDMARPPAGYVRRKYGFGPPDE